MTRLGIQVAGLALALSVFPASGRCADSTEPSSSTARLAPSYLDASGAVRVAGYNDMRTILERLDTLYVAAHPGIRFHLELHGRATAVAALTHGTTLLAPVGAEFSALELVPYLKIVGRPPLLIRVAHATPNHEAKSGPLAIIVHRSNPLDSLSVSELRRIFGAGAPAGSVTEWSQLLQDGEGRGSIHPCGLAEDTALGTFFQNRALHRDGFVPAFDGFSESRAVIQRVASDPAAIGFASATAVDASVKVIAVASADGAPAVQPTVEQIRTGGYAFDRFLYFALRQTAAGTVDPVAVEYTRAMLSEAGQAIVGSSAPGYLPLQREEIAAELARLDHALAPRKP